MSNNMFHTPAKIKREIIAGNHSGKKVTINPNYDVEYKGLLHQARKNNYWAVVSINSLHSLSSGNLHQDNIYVEQIEKHRGGLESFKMVLPGVTAQISRSSDDSFHIDRLDVTSDFSDLQKDQIKPGLYKAEWEHGLWTTTLKKGSGAIEEKDSRVVAISDARINIEEEINVIFEYISQAPDASGGRLKRVGFDIHFTPGAKQLGTLKNYKEAKKPLEISRIKESSQMLAKSLYDARKREEVILVSEFGGSAVLTQAMKALADSGAKLENHSFFMVRPATNPDTALDYAIRLNMGIGRKYKKSEKLSFVSYMGEIKSINRRLDARKNGHDYSKIKACSDYLAYGKSCQGAAIFFGGVATSIAGGAIAAAAASAGSTAVTLAPAIVSFFKGAAATAAGIAAGTTAGVKAVGTVNTITKHVAPDFHAKNIDSKL